MVLNLIKNLFPKGSPYTLLGNFGKLIKGISISIELLYQFAKNTLLEANPSNTTDLINEWFNTLNIKNIKELSISEKRSILNANYTGVGGQSRQYIESQIQKIFPNIQIKEFTFPVNFMVGIGMTGQMQVSSYPSWIPSIAQDGTYPVYYYQVTGKVANVTQYLILQDLLKRYAPLTHIPIYININFYSNTGMVGVGQTGISEVGRNQT